MSFGSLGEGVWDISTCRLGQGRAGPLDSAKAPSKNTKLPRYKGHQQRGDAADLRLVGRT